MTTNRFKSWGFSPTIRAEMGCGNCPNPSLLLETNGQQECCRVKWKGRSTNSPVNQMAPFQGYVWFCVRTLVGLWNVNQMNVFLDLYGSDAFLQKLTTLIYCFKIGQVTLN